VNVILYYIIPYMWELLDGITYMFLDDAENSIIWIWY